MNDVLPKPFTKEGLLNMLEKYLGHLKLRPDGLEMMPNSASTVTHSSANQSIKDEASPGQSPSTASNWHSPGQFSGISPTLANPARGFMQAVSGPTTFGMDATAMQFQQPQTPIGVAGRNVHRRQISEISAGDETTNDPKRPRTYAQNNVAMSHLRR